MAADYGKVIGSVNAFSFSGLSTLANGTFVASSAADFTAPTPDPDDIIIEAAFTPGTVSGNKQARVYLQTAVDGGTDFSTGPTSGTSTTDEPNLMLIGAVPLNTNSTLQRKHFSVLAALGFIPTDGKCVVLNDSGAAFSAGTVNWYAVKGVSI